MSSSLPEAEFKALSKFQVKLHGTDPAACDNVERSTPFVTRVMPCHWYSLKETRMVSNETADGANYTPNFGYHFLTSSDMKFSLPVIKVRAEKAKTVQICWPHNIGTAMFTSASFWIDDKCLQEFDRCWCDCYFQFNMDPGFRDSHKLAVGSVPALEDWTDHLPAYTTNVQLPWWYLLHPFPLHLFKIGSTRIEHRFVFRRRILEILRMRIFDEDKGVWREIKPNFDYIVGANSDSLMPLPELWGSYGYVSKDELEHHKKNKDPVIYVKHAIAVDAANACTYGSCTDIQVKTESPCLAFFWLAENETAKRARILSNYTTGNDYRRGFDPVSKSSLLYLPNMTCFKDMTSDHFSISQARKFFSSPPSETGYHAYSFCTDPFSSDPEVGIHAENLRALLSVRIDDTDIYKVEPKSIKTTVDESADEDGEIVVSRNRTPEFMVRLRVYVVDEYVIRDVDGVPVFEKV